MAKATQIRKIEDSEAFSATNTYVGNKTIQSVFAIRRSENEPRYQKEMVLDFGGVSDEQLTQLAMYGVKVKVQSLLRAMPPETMLHPDTLAKVDVLKDIIDAPAKASDPVSAAVRSLMKTGIPEDVARQMLADAHEKAEGRKQEGKKARSAA